mmetsp:Transcript_115798/g.327554  ORF Transcript_115798/g.327554 Transcript_115798/m.327554 type:complete len:216 (+) Transcript_115798:709-1356(+)
MPLTHNVSISGSCASTRGRFAGTPEAIDDPGLCSTPANGAKTGTSLIAGAVNGTPPQPTIVESTSRLALSGTFTFMLVLATCTSRPTVFATSNASAANCGVWYFTKALPPLLPGKATLKATKPSKTLKKSVSTCSVSPCSFTPMTHKVSLSDSALKPEAAEMSVCPPEPTPPPMASPNPADTSAPLSARLAPVSRPSTTSRGPAMHWTPPFRGQG